MKRIASLILSIIILISTASCAWNRQAAPGGGNAAGGEGDEIQLPERPPAPEIVFSDRFTIAHTPHATLNPYTTTSRDNLNVSGLIYEGLFVLDGQFNATPVLAENLTTTDGIRHTLTLRAGVYFHNGVPLGVDDVLYSLERAIGSVLFGSRLRIIADFSRGAGTDEAGQDNSIEIVLRQIHGNLPALLTFPIIQQGSHYWTVPPGTGAYRFSSEDDSMRLVAFDNHWGGHRHPLETIYLMEVHTLDDLATHFNSGALNMIGTTITETGMPRIGGNRDLRHYPTTLFDFIGFNLTHPVSGQRILRHAIHFSINREYIAESILGGAMVGTALPIHPLAPFYDPALSAAWSWDLARSTGLIYAFYADLDFSLPGLEGDDDPADEGSLIPDGFEEEIGHLSFLVAAGSVARFEVAAYIAEQLERLGFAVSLNVLPFDQYMQALEAGDFDIFYGQVRIQPDFDLSELLFGHLTFGYSGGLVDRRLQDRFLAAGTTGGRQETASELCTAILHMMPFSPIGFRKQTAITQRGMISGIAPTQENLFGGVWGWNIQLGQADGSE